MAYSGLKSPKPLVPYAISGVLSRESTTTGYIDAAWHVAMWVAVWVFEILTFVALSRHEEDIYKDIGSADKDKTHPMIAVSLGSLVTLAIAGFALILVLGAHILTNGIEDGKLPPMVTSIMSGGLKGSIFFSMMVAATSFLIFMMEDMTTTAARAMPCSTSKDCAHKVAATLLGEEEMFLNYIVVLIILKLYVHSIILNNLRVAVPADQSEPHHMFAGA